jgi:hypothetical protein
MEGLCMTHPYYFAADELSVRRSSAKTPDDVSAP